MKKVFLIFLAIRFLSVYLVQTFYVPDEYYQILEIAHYLTYGYGHVTWEWIEGIRSYIPPLVVVGLYKILHFARLDSAETLIYGPRILQALLSSYSDTCFYKWSGTKKWALFVMASSWFWFYTGSRTLINTLECSLTTIAVSKFPWPGKRIDDTSSFIWITALLFSIRPTSAVILFPLCLYHLVITKSPIFTVVAIRYLPIGILVLTLNIVLDTICYGSILVTTYEFFKFNLLQNLSSFYGVQPWHWYVWCGFPCILGIQILPFILGAAKVLKNMNTYPNEVVMLGIISFTLFIFSLLPHKEFRFILPLLPMAFYIASKFLSVWSRKASKFSIWLVSTIILIGNIGPAWYLGMVHQRGPLDVMASLREICIKNPENTSLLFLMPCHSTPLYSHLHYNVSARFLTCLPNLRKVENYVDEADIFYENPSDWLRMNYPSHDKYPSHVISFDILVPFIETFLNRYKKSHEIFSTHLTTSSRVGRYIIIHQKIDL